MWYWNHWIEGGNNMSFLDNLKKKRAAEKAAAETPALATAPATEGPKEEEPAVKKVNPLAALKAKKATPAAEGETPKTSSLLERMKAKRKAQDTEAEAKAEEPKQEETKEEKKTSLQERAEAIVAEKLKDKAPEADDPAVVDTENEADKKAEEAEEAMSEEAVAEAEPEEPSEEEQSEQEEAASEESAQEEAKEEEEKPKKRRRRKSSKKEEEPVEEAPVEEQPKQGKKQQDIKVHEYVANYDILGKKVSYDDMAGAVMDYFIDDDWKAIQDDLTEKMNNIRIEPDMNPGTLKYALAELNNLNDEISAAYVEQKQILDMLTDKEFGAATALMAMNQRGSNSEERKANGFAALTHAKFGGDDEVNLIALINAVKARFVFLNSLSKRIQYKSNTCITMSGAMKMEQSLMVGAQIA